MELKRFISQSFAANLLISCLVSLAFQPVLSQPPGKVVIGYVGGFRGLVNTGVIQAEKLTHINYAFVDIQNNRAWLHNEGTDTTNFRRLNELKIINPGLKILISIGGWSWSENFSDAVFTDSSRKIFARSAVEIMHQHHLDGVDIDWEYPGMKGEEGNIYRPEDKQNFTLMFAQLRKTLDSLEQLTQKKYLLTTAVGGSQSFIRNTEMDKVAPYLDFINLMTYDFSWRIAGHHANLFHSKNDTTSSADKTVKAYVNAGVPVSKLVMGLAFYGRGSVVDDSGGKWFYKPITATIKGGGYSFLKDSLVNKAGYKYFWDRRAKSPYLFNKTEKAFISFENERAIKLKCRYVLKNNLAGVMFWEYFNDPKGYLLGAINDVFR
jgi:chitinase